MKKLILLTILLLLIPISLAKTEKITMYPGMSRVIENSNITLISLDEKENKVIVCINNEKKILEEDTERTLGKLRINVKSIDLNSAELELKSDCKDCTCTSDCSNDLCFPEVKQESENETAVMPNPATVYCESHNGKSDIRTLEDGSQTGYCMFSNENECEEWAFYRGDCKQETVETPKQKSFWEKLIAWIKSL